MRIAVGSQFYGLQPVTLKSEVATLVDSTKTEASSEVFELYKHTESIGMVSAGMALGGSISGYALRPLPILARAQPLVEAAKAGADLGAIAGMIPGGVSDTLDGVAAIFATMEVIQHMIDPNPKITGAAEKIMYAKAATSVASAVADLIPALAPYSKAIKGMGLIVKAADGTHSAWVVREED